MKSIILQSILILFIAVTAFSQIETFEDETKGDSSFTVLGLSFTTTGDLVVDEDQGFGCEQSDTYLDTGFGDGGSSGSVGSIKVTNPGDFFRVSTETSWCVYLSDSDGLTGVDGDIKFTGTLSSGDTIEETIRVVHSQASWDRLTFSPEIWDTQELTELEVSIFANVNYLSLDNIAFNNSMTTSISNHKDESIKIYPNPAVNEISIIGMDDGNIIIFDAYGRIIKDQSLFNSKIDISGLPDGVYFISLYSPNQPITKRIIKR